VNWLAIYNKEAFQTAENYAMCC